MDRLAMLFNNIYSKMYFTLILAILIIMSCEEQVDDLWDTDDGTDQISPLVGDWYAESMSAYDSYYYEEWNDLMLDNQDQHQQEKLIFLELPLKFVQR